MKYYSKKDTNVQVIIDDNINIGISSDYILMNGPQPSIDYVAQENGEWILEINKLKRKKELELKEIRDIKDQEPVEYNDMFFDYDMVSITKLRLAKEALIRRNDNPPETWILADNGITQLTSADIIGIDDAAVLRSRELHEHYLKLKYLISLCETVEEINQITWDSDVSQINDIF